MKLVSLVLLLSILPLEAEEKLSLARGIPPAGTYESTYQVKYRENLVTGFSIEVDERQYIIAARHVIEGFEPGDSLHLGVNHISLNYCV